MSKDLNIAMQNAIGDLGTDVLKSPFLVNILQDYGAFDVHDKSSLVIKQRLAELVKEGLVEEIVSWKKLSGKKIQSNGLSLLKRYNDADDVRYIVESLLKIVGLPTLPSPGYSSYQTKNISNTANNSTPNSTVIKHPNKTTNINHSEKYKRFSTKNLVCAVISLVVSIISIFYAVLMIIDGNWDDIEGVFVAIILGLVLFIVGVIGPFANPDFWK